MTSKTNAAAQQPLDALTALIGAVRGERRRFTLLGAQAQPWRSKTFSGTRAELRFRLGSERDARRFAARTGRLPLSFNGHLLADAFATSDGATVHLSALTVED